MKPAFVCALLVLIYSANQALAAPAPMHMWSKSCGGTQGDYVNDIAVDASGNVFICGHFFGTTNLGGTPLVSVGEADIFVAKYNAAGVHQWSKSFGTLTYDGADGIAVDPVGNVIITGFATGSIDMGGGYLQAFSGPDIIIAKYDAAGVHQWSKRFPNFDALDEGQSVATDASGNVFVTGSFRKSVDFGGGPLQALPVQEDDGFIVKFDPSGAHQWSRRFGNAAVDNGIAVATDGNGNVTVAGLVERYAVDFGGGPLPALGGSDAFIARYDANGTHLWSRRFGGAGNDAGTGVACDATGNVALTGAFEGNASFGGAPLTSSGQRDFLLARFDSGGGHVWSRGVGGTGDDYAYGAALEPAGDVIVTGYFYNTVDFGGGPVVGQGQGDTFIARYDMTGAYQWLVTAGNVNADWGTAVAVNNTSVIGAGSFQASVDFGGGPLPNAGDYDVFLVSLLDAAPVPVLISNFTAKPSGEGIEVAWRVWSDENVEGFTLNRRTASEDATSIAEGALDGPAHSFLDARVEPGMRYEYSLVLHTASGSDIQSQPVSATMPSPGVWLGQNSPNPFHGITRVEYTLNTRTNAAIDIYDAAGRRVGRIVQGTRDAGTYSFEWDGRDGNGTRMSSGVYFYRLAGAPAGTARKMVLLR